MTLIEKHQGSRSDFSIISQEEFGYPREPGWNMGGRSHSSSTAIASISLLVGGIGEIMTICSLRSRRTNEIPNVKRIVRQTSTEIHSQFLAEAVILTFIGGFRRCCVSWAQIVWRHSYWLVSHPVTFVLLYFCLGRIGSHRFSPLVPTLLGALGY